MSGDKRIIQIPAGLLMGCHNCKWKIDAKVCYERDHGEEECWENDGTFDPWGENQSSTPKAKRENK